jgi:hypothetical protein
VVGSGWRACRITAASAHRGAHCRGWRAGVAFPQALARYDGVTAVTQEWAGTRVEDGIKASRRVANRTVSPPASLVGGLTVWTIRAYEPAFPEGCRDTDPIKAWPGVLAAGRGRACWRRWPSWLSDGLCPSGHAAGCSPPVVPAPDAQAGGSGRHGARRVATPGGRVGRGWWQATSCRLTHAYAPCRGPVAVAVGPGSSIGGGEEPRLGRGQKKPSRRNPP